MRVHTGGGDTSTQAKEGALREENLSSKLITWKDRTECELHCSYLTDLETSRQAARVNTAELLVPPPLQRARLQPGRGRSEAAGARGTSAGLAAGSVRDSWPPRGSSGSLACPQPPAAAGEGARGAAAPLLAATLRSGGGSPGGVTALHSQFGFSVSKELCQSKNSHV